MVLDRDVTDTGDVFEHRGAHRGAELELHPPNGLRPEAGDGLECDQPPVADDPDPVGYPLHLREGVAGEEDGAPLGGHLAHHLLELALDQRVEAGAGLVHDQHLRPVHESLDHPDLLAVARGQIAHLLRQVRVEPVGEVIDVAPVDAAPQVGEVCERVAPGEIGVHRQVTRHIADVAADLDGLLVGVQPENRGPPRGGPDLVEQGADGGRLAGAVGAEIPEDLTSTDIQVQVHEGLHVSVVLGQPLGVDGDLIGHGVPSL